jgi:prepilin signal peptidase PulO-like enzyme (type II secretory pathway)
MRLLSPVVAYAAPEGRYERYSVRTELIHPILAAVAVALVAGCGIAFGLTLQGLVAAFFCLTLVVVTATDLEYRIVPNRVVFPAAPIVLVGMTAADPSPEWIIAASAAFAGLLLAALAYPAGMGYGDVKLAFLMGAALGRSVVVAIVVALVMSALLTIVLFARHGRSARKMTFPFAPFLAAGSIVALFAGEALLDAYLSQQ